MTRRTLGIVRGNIGARGSIGRRMLVASAVVAFVAVPAACGKQEERSLCVVYDDYLASRAAVMAVEPTAQTAAEAATIVEAYLRDIQRLRETDGVNNEAVDALEAAVADVLRTLESVDAGEDYATWAPLVEDSVDDANKAADRVEELTNPQCKNES